MTRAPWVTHFGFTRTPFSKNIPAKDLLERASHQEAVARIRFCIAESSLGVVTGEVGVGKTVALRAADTDSHVDAQRTPPHVFASAWRPKQIQSYVPKRGVACQETYK